MVKDLPGEIWKDVTGYKKEYQVSNFGRVKSLGRFILRSKDKKPRFIPEKILKIHQGRVTFRRYDYMNVGRMVARAFMFKEFIKYPIVIHLNGDRDDNRLDNLKCCKYPDMFDNSLKEGRIDFNKKVKCIETGQIFKSTKEAARWLGEYSSSNLGKHLNKTEFIIIDNRNNKHISRKAMVKSVKGYHFEYVD